MSHARAMRALVLLLALGATTLAGRAPAPGAVERATLSYVVAVDPAAQVYRVDVCVSGAAEPAVDLRMPTWQPASYALQPYAEAVADASARDEAGAALRVTRPDPNTWRVEAGGHPSFTLSYTLDVSERRRLYSRSYAYPTGGALQAGGALLFAPAHRDAPVAISFDLPQSWQVATPLVGGPRAFTAADYDELVDSPVLFGELQRREFAVHGIPFSAVADARMQLDMDALVDSLRRTATAEIEMFGEAPFDRYQFLYLMTPDPSGNGEESLAVGVEHAKSTLITVNPTLVQARTALGAVLDETNAHELFHAWNVKAIHPESLHEPDYDAPPRVPSLWLLEGVTSYYTHRLLAATSPDPKLGGIQLRSQLAQAVTAAPKGKSLEELALKIPEQGLDLMWPIYQRGEGIGLLLDVEIRRATNDRAGLDDVMRRLYERSQRGTRPYREQDIAGVVSEVAGRDMSGFFRRYVAGSDQPPYDEILGAAGLRFGDLSIDVAGRRVTLRGLVDERSPSPLARAIRSSILPNNTKGHESDR